jgi:hypothetical protein
VKDKFYATNVTGIEDLETQTRAVTRTISRGVLARKWEELEFGLDVLRATQVAHLELRSGYEKNVCTLQIKLASHSSRQFMIFNRVIKSIRHFWPTVYYLEKFRLQRIMGDHY